MPKSGSSRTAQTESSDSNSNMVEKQTGRKNKEKVTSYNRTPKIDRSELEKEVKEKTSMKRKLPFTVSPSRSEQRESDTDSDPGHSSETWGERLIPPYRTYSEKEGPEKKKMKKEPGSKKSVPVCKATLGGILIGYPLSERQQMALVMQMTARDNSPDSTPNHPSQATPGQKKTPSSSSRQKDKVNKRNERGETPLHMAAIRGETKQVKELISQGADVNVKDFAGWTPLHEACNLGYYEVAKQLILAGADVNTRGLENDTPLHDAASNGHRDIVKLLLRNGGDAYQMNHRGERPVDVADSDEMEQLLKGELPLSDDEDDDSCTESEELPSVNPSSVDDNVDDSEAEKELKTDTNQQLTPCKSIASSALDEYEFKDDDDEDVDEDEEEISKLVDQKRIRRRDGKKSVVKENSSYLTPPKLEFQKPFKIKKQKSARVLVSSSSDSSDDELHQEKKICSTSSLEIVPDSSKSDARTKKENLVTLEQKEKGKGKKKVKKQSKNKENQEFKEEKEEKENAKLMLFSTCSALDSLDRSREEDSFRKSLKDDSSGHQFHLSTAKSPKHACGLNEKRAKPLKQENTKTAPSSGASEITFQSEVVRFDHLTDSDYTSESSSNKSFKYNTKTKHHKKDLSVEFGEKSGQRSKEEETGIFDNMEEVFKKTDKDGKVIKKHKLKHKDKEKNKIKKEHENEKGKHRQKESEKIYPEFDREYWKENFFKNDDTNETFKDENSNLALAEKPLKDKTPIKEEKVSKEKYFKEEKPFKEDREKEKSKKNKKEKHYKEEKEIKLTNLEERKEIVLADKDDSLYSGVFLKKEHTELFEKEKGTDKEKSDTPDKEKKENKEKSEKKSPTKERDLEKLERKYSDREKKIKHENRSEKEKSETHEKTQEKSFSKLQESGERTKEKDRSGSLYSTSEKVHRENDKLKNVFSVKKPEEKEKSKEKLDKKHEREKIERERHSSGIKDKVEKEKHTNEKKTKFSEKDLQDSILSKADKVKVKEKDRDIEKEKKKEKSREREGDPVTNSKHLHDEKKRSTVESSKGSHDKLFSSKDKIKEDFPKTPETKEREKKEKDRQKDKVPVNTSVKAKLKEPEADKLKSKDSGATKDVRPKEKRLVNDDLMQTSFERMLSLKDLEIEQWHKKHKEKIKMKEKERQRHRSGIDLSKIKEREKLKSSTTSKELTRSKSSDPSEVHLKDKQLKDVNSVKSLTTDTKQNLPETPRPLMSCESNLTASPRQERDRMGLTSRSISMISVASSEDSCQTSAVATPRPLTDYDSDFTIEGSESQSSFSQSVFLSSAKSPAVYDRDSDVLADLPDRLKSPHSSKLSGSYLRSVSADNGRCENECRSVGDVRRCSIPAVANDHDKPFHKQVEVSLPLSSEKQYSFSPAVQSQACTSPRSEPLPDSGPEEGTCNSTSCLQSPAVTVPSDTNYLSQDANPNSILVQSTSQQMPVVQPQLNCLISDIQPEKPMEMSYDRLDVPSLSSNDGYTTTAACEKNIFSPLPHVPQEWSCSDQITSELVSKSPQRLCSESSQVANLLEAPSYFSPTHSSNSSCTRSPLDGDGTPRVLFWPKCGGTQEDLSQTQTSQDTDQSSISCKPHVESSGIADEKDGKCPSLDVSSDLASQKTVEDPANDCKPSEMQDLEENSSTPSAALPDGSNVNENLVDQIRTVQSLLTESQEKMEGTKSTVLASHEPACNQESSLLDTVPVASVDEMQSEPKEELPEATPSTEYAHTHSVSDQSQSLESKAQDQDSSLEMEVSQHFTAAGRDPVMMHEGVSDEQRQSTESMKEESEDRMEADRTEQDIPQRITRNRANILANQSKQSAVNCAQVSDKDTESVTPVKSKSKLTEEEEGQVHHPHKRKLSRVPHPTQVKSTLQQAKEKTQQSLAAIVDSLKLEEIQPYHSEKANPYYEYLHIRKKIEEKRKVLCSVTPQAPQFYDEFVTFTGSYLLDGNPLSKLCIPTITPPPSLSEALKELFRQQEVIRMKLRLQHSIEREKLIMSNEQEVLRVHYRAARTLANQTLPFSACTVLLDAEVYNMPQDPQGDENKTSVRDRFNARQFMSWLQDVDDKFDKLKTCLLMRQQHEAAAMNAVQRLEWQLKLQELDPSSHKSLSIFEIPEFYIPLVDVNDDFDLTPI